MIRAGQESDIPALVEMGMRFVSGTAYAGMIVADADAIGRSLAALLAMPTGIVLVQDGGGTICGAIIGMVVPHFVSGKQAAVELAWWVNPESRGGGIRLLKAFETKASEMGAASISVTEPPENEVVGMIYRRLGYAQIESTYLKAI